MEKIAARIKESNIEAGNPSRESLGQPMEAIFGRPMNDNMLDKVHNSLAAYFLEPEEGLAKPL